MCKPKNDPQRPAREGSRGIRRDRMADEGLWISPEGRRFPVVEHIQFLQQHPSVFDLTPDDVDLRGLLPDDAVARLQRLAMAMIGQGWLRYRMLDLTHHLELAELAPCGSAVIDILNANASWPAGETIEITLYRPSLRTVVGSVADFLRDPPTLVQACDPSDAHRHWAFALRR